jgi:hypothetical protein
MSFFKVIILGAAIVITRPGCQKDLATSQYLLCNKLKHEY